MQSLEDCVRLPHDKDERERRAVANWLMVPVREDMMKEVIDMIQKHLDDGQDTTRGTANPDPVDGGPSVAPSDEDGGVGPYYAGLTEADLRDMLLKPTRSMGILLRYFAIHPEEDVDRMEMTRLAYGENGTHSQLSGALGSFTRRNRGRYGRDVWPFYVSGYDEERGQWTFRMDAKTAEAIRRILEL